MNSQRRVASCVERRLTLEVSVVALAVCMLGCLSAKSTGTYYKEQDPPQVGLVKGKLEYELKPTLVVREDGLVLDFDTNCKQDVYAQHYKDVYESRKFGVGNAVAVAAVGATGGGLLLRSSGKEDLEIMDWEVAMMFGGTMLLWSTINTARVAGQAKDIKVNSVQAEPEFKHAEFIECPFEFDVVKIWNPANGSEADRSMLDPGGEDHRGLSYGVDAVMMVLLFDSANIEVRVRPKDRGTGREERAQYELGDLTRYVEAACDRVTPELFIRAHEDLLPVFTAIGEKCPESSTGFQLSAHLIVELNKQREEQKRLAEQREKEANKRQACIEGERKKWERKHKAWRSKVRTVTTCNAKSYAVGDLIPCCVPIYGEGNPGYGACGVDVKAEDFNACGTAEITKKKASSCEYVVSMSNFQLYKNAWIVGMMSYSYRDGVYADTYSDPPYRRLGTLRFNASGSYSYKKIPYPEPQWDSSKCNKKL